MVEEHKLLYALVKEEAHEDIALLMFRVRDEALSSSLGDLPQREIEPSLCHFHKN